MPYLQLTQGATDTYGMGSTRRLLAFQIFMEFTLLWGGVCNGRPYRLDYWISHGGFGLAFGRQPGWAEARWDLNMVHVHGSE
jgi:hypothetical protein